MTVLGWLVTGFALLLVPGRDPLTERVRSLAARGRLGPAPRPVGRRPVDLRALPVIAVGVIAVLVAVCAGAVLALSAAIAVAVVTRLIVVARRRRRSLRRAARLHAALRVLVAELEAGARPEVALLAAAAVCPAYADEFRRAAQECEDGADLTMPSGPLTGLAQAWRVAAVSGAPLAEVVGRVADDVASGLEQRRAVDSAVAGARSSAALLAGLPVLGILLGTAMQSDPLHVLLSSSSGRLLCLTGVGLDALGLLWTQRLTDRAAPE